MVECRFGPKHHCDWAERHWTKRGLGEDRRVCRVGNNGSSNETLQHIMCVDKQDTLPNNRSGAFFNAEVDTYSGPSIRIQCVGAITGQYVYFPTTALEQPLSIVEVAVWSADCAVCPANSQSLEGSVERSDCKCNMGFSGPDGGPCRACPAGTFKGKTGSGACSTCAANTNSLAQNAYEHRCSCNAGFYADMPPENASCTEVSFFNGEYEQTRFTCADRQLSSGVDCYDVKDVSDQWVGNKVSRACLLCPCSCAENPYCQTIIDNNLITKPPIFSCVACAVGTYKSGQGPKACTSCPAHPPL